MKRWTNAILPHYEVVPTQHNLLWYNRGVGSKVVRVPTPCNDVGSDDHRGVDTRGYAAIYGKIFVEKSEEYR